MYVAIFVRGGSTMWMHIDGIDSRMFPTDLPVLVLVLILVLTLVGSISLSALLLYCTVLSVLLYRRIHPQSMVSFE
jgi:hypothetical protein